MKDILNAVFEKGTLISIGRRKMRTAREFQIQSTIDPKTKKTMQREQILAEMPETIPFTYLDVSGLTVKQVCSHGDYAVDANKLVRKMEEDEVGLFRDNMRKDNQALTVEHPNDAFFVINCRNMSLKGDALLSSSDKLAKVKAKQPELFAALFNEKEVKDQEAMIEIIWDEIKKSLK